MIPEKVRRMLDAHGLAATEFAPGSTATSVLAAEQLGVAVGQIAKSMLFAGKDSRAEAFPLFLRRTASPSASRAIRDVNEEWRFS